MDTLPRSFNEVTKSLRESNVGIGSGGRIVHEINYKHYAIMTVFFTILVLSMVWLLHHDSRKCTIDQHKVESCLRRLVFFSSNNEHFPHTDKQLDVYCKEKAKSIQCLRHFVEGCLEVDKQQRKYFKKYVLNYKYQLDKTCLHRSERQKFINYAGCLSESDLLKNATNCNEIFQNQLIYIAQNVKGEQKIPIACCAFHHRNQCLDKKIAAGCKNEVTDFVRDQIEGPFREILQSLCTSNHSTFTGCQNSFESSLWNKIFQHPENLVKKFNHSENKFIQFDENSNATVMNNNLRFKIVQLKFYENFLSFFLIIRSDRN